MPSSWVKGFDFRATSGFVTDTGNNTYVLYSDVYTGSVIRNSVAFGWDSAVSGIDRDNTADARIAGINYSLPNHKFRVNLPQAGNYKVYFANGDRGSPQTVPVIKIYDNTTLLLTGASGSLSADHYFDASGVDRSGAVWVATTPGGTASAQLTFATTAFFLEITGGGGTNGIIAHLTIEYVDPPPPPPPPPTYFHVLEMEFAGRGNGWTQVFDVLVASGITWRRGFAGSQPLDLVADTGTMHFSLDNSEINSARLLGYYSPDHANKRAGFGLNIGVRYRLGAVVRFTGTISAIDPVPGVHGPRTVECEAVDWVDVAARTHLANLPVLVNKRGDEVFQTLLDSLSIIARPDAVEKDTSSDIFPYTLDRTRDEQTVLRDEIYRLCVSGLDRAWVKGSGTVVYESRTRRATNTTISDTFTDSNGFIAKRDRTGVINRVQSTVNPRVPSLVSIVMYALTTPTPITPGNPVVILGPWTDPANPDIRVGAVTLDTVTATTDYLVNTAADGSGADLTSSLTVTVGLSGNATQFTLTLGGGQAGFVTKLQQRGMPLYDYGATVMPWSDALSIEQHGLVNLPIDMSYQADLSFGLEAAQYIIFLRANPVTQISGLMRYVDLGNATEVARSINREISDRVALLDTVTGINRSFFINAIDEVEIDGVLQTEFLLEPADSTAFWLLEVVGRSELDATTRLGFGLITGHTDVAHVDNHGDVAHGDSTGHGDVAHTDVAHEDTHGDAGHGDSHGDTAHSDVAHADSHTDVHGDHNDVTGHSDAHTDGWTYHDSAHSDVAHTDIAHGDNYHTDHTDATPPVPYAPGHQDYDGTINYSTPWDTHTDTAHTDVSHSDTAHTDYNHYDYHSDVAHIDTHNDVAHVDAHSDTAHTDSHGDVTHVDVPAHSDTGHSDVVHTDTHGDVSHGDH